MLEYEPFAQRVLVMLVCARKYVQQVDKGKVKLPGTKTFEIVRDFAKDRLLEAKLACFISKSNKDIAAISFYLSDWPSDM